MNKPIMPPLEPWLIPQGAKKRKEKRPKGPAVAFSNAKTEPQAPETPEPPAKPEPKKYKLEQAFNYLWQPVSDDEEKDFNVERASATKITAGCSPSRTGCAPSCLRSTRTPKMKLPTSAP